MKRPTGYAQPPGMILPVGASFEEALLMIARDLEGEAKAKTKKAGKRMASPKKQPDADKKPPKKDESEEADE